MDIASLSPQLAGSTFDPERIAHGNQSEAEKIAHLAQQFEAVLLRQILHDAQKTIIKSDLTTEDSSSDIYRDMVSSQLADTISQSGSFGFGRALEEDLTRQLRNSKPQPPK